MKHIKPGDQIVYECFLRQNVDAHVGHWYMHHSVYPIIWKRFPYCWPFVRVIQRTLAIPLRKSHKYDDLTLF